MIFDDILEIKNGRNQKNVENPNGKYPIYGSGGIMGYADDYICEADTVIIGRKGSINNPIYVEEPFWNVDTAFGLSAKREILMPRYLYYFCQYFDFERLNKAVTIPSLTKSDLLKIELKLPTIETQKKIVDRLIKVEQIIQLKKRELQKLDTLVKSRFVELFGDPIKNPKGWEVVKASGCENAMLILDTWHWVRANQPYDILTPEIAKKVISIQINDAYERPYADSILRDESMHDRLAPGTGAKDTAGFVKMIKDAGVDPKVIGVEVISDEILGRGLKEAAAYTYENTEKVLKEAWPEMVD